MSDWQGRGRGRGQQNDSPVTRTDQLSHPLSVCVWVSNPCKIFAEVKFSEMGKQGKRKH